MDTQENEVRLYYTWRGGDKNASVIEEGVRQRWLSALGEKKRQAILRLRNLSDQDSSLLGLRLLDYGARDMQVDDFRLAELVYPDRGKPYWRNRTRQAGGTGGLDFNITHSHRLVMVALSRSSAVGVDVEKIRPLKRLAFKAVMQPQELAQIAQQPALFFRLWSIKEAVVKAADCAGLSRLLDVQIDAAQATARFDGQDWYLKQLALDPAYSLSLASSLPVTEVSLTALRIEMLDDTAVSATN